MPQIRIKYGLFIMSLLFSSMTLADAMCGPNGQFNPNDNRCWPIQGGNTTSARVDYWGAIALERKGARAKAAINFSTESKAATYALQHCGDNCVVYITYKNTCAAVVTGRNLYLHADTGNNPKTLRTNMLSRCNAQSENCQVWVEPACAGR